jgi:DNA sulfur modification protein DndD
MILDEITLHNFGVYKGRQSLRLTPPSQKKPIILLGGLNGGGKTTLLDALQLAFYGKLANCSNRGSLGYEEFLRRSIHRSVDGNEGAALELEFRHHTEGKEHTYRIHRSWAQNGSSIRERFEVICDDEFDNVMTESWNEYVEVFIPVRISPLFFFDGEMIEGFADLENSSEVLATGIQSLLGLDIVDRLMTDLVVLERKKSTSLKNDTERQQIDLAKAELEHLQELRQKLDVQKDAAQNELGRLEKYLKEVNHRYRTQGGELFERREAIEAARVATEKHLSEVEEELRELAAGSAPLILVPDLLTDIEEQDRDEEVAVQTEILSQILADRDAVLLNKVIGFGGTDNIIFALERYLIEDRKERTAVLDVYRYLELDSESRIKLRALQTTTLNDSKKHATRLIKISEELQNDLVDIERKLASIPDEDAIAHLIAEREQARLALLKSQEKMSTIDAEIERNQRELDQKQAKLVSRIEQTVALEFEKEDIGRIINHSQRVRQTLNKFRESVLESHVNRIQRLVLDSFKQLLRKDSLVSDLRIDPRNFSLELRGPNSKILSPDRLSAGERQLLAVSMLWGLARASGRPLPFPSRKSPSITAFYG